MSISHSAGSRTSLFRNPAWLLVPVLALCACAALGARDSRPPIHVYRSGDNYVDLVPIESGTTANAHPVTVSIGRLTRLLAGARVKGAASIGAIPVFSREELETIVPPLVSALGRADPNQDVTFAVASHRGMFGTYSPQSVTTGRLFASADGLNLIFGVVQQRMDTGTLDGTDIAPVIVPGTRARRIDSTVWKMTPGAARFHGARGDWLVFDRADVSAPAATQAGATAPGTGASSGTAAETAPAIESREREIENRLQVLEALRKKGVITEQEYRERRQAILQAL